MWCKFLTDAGKFKAGQIVQYDEETAAGLIDLEMVEESADPIDLPVFTMAEFCDGIINASVAMVKDLIKVTGGTSDEQSYVERTMRKEMRGLAKKILSGEKVEPEYDDPDWWKEGRTKLLD